ncbi:MAG: GDP-L-fucose synthase [Magnetococcus sp. WYHC-3]
MQLDDAIFVAGHRGLVGSALVRVLERRGHRRLLLRSRQELDLADAVAVDGFFQQERPAWVFLAAARVGGIHANSTYPADFILSNLRIQCNVIESAHRHGAHKLIFLGSSCIYPRLAPQPMQEVSLLSGPLEPTNQWYAIAKIAGILTCQAFRRQHGFSAISLMPTNLYGPHDNFHPENAHVLPSLIRRFHEAKVRGDAQVVVWGSGTPRREFLHVDDCAEACLFLAEHYDDEAIINVGVGADQTIRELAEMVRDVVGFPGELVFDPSRPDGTPRKLLDVSRLNALGWRPRIGLREGIEDAYRWFIAHQEDYRQ